METGRSQAPLYGRLTADPRGLLKVFPLQLVDAGADAVVAAVADAVVDAVVDAPINTRDDTITLHSPIKNPTFRWGYFR
jgi:hypothetical protein